MDSFDIEKAAITNLLGKHFNMVIPRIYFFEWESDLFCITKMGEIHEYEIKLSKADFKKDFLKEKHELFNNHKLLTEGKHATKEPSLLMPNKYYFICPKGLLNLDDIPSYAGLIYVSESKVKKQPVLKFTEVKNAKTLHSGRLTKDKMHTIMYKLYYRYIDMKYGVSKYKK